MKLLILFIASMAVCYGLFARVPDTLPPDSPARIIYYDRSQEHTDSFAVPERTTCDSPAAISVTELAGDALAIDGHTMQITAAPEPYFSTVIGSLYALKFRIRGYDSRQTEIYVNGLWMNDAATGQGIFFTGLNDVFRNGEAVYGLQGRGQLNGYTAIDLCAARESPQSRVTYTLSGGVNSHRISVAHHTGLMRNGWAVTLAWSGRRVSKAYVEGTSGNSYAYGFALSKKLGIKSMVHFFALGNYRITAGSTAATQEVYDLAGTGAYNPAWGYQNGVQRSANERESLQPLYGLQYEYKTDHGIYTKIMVAYQHGYSQRSGLNWYNSADPRPDYYKKMPSYYTHDPATADYAKAAIIRERWQSDAGMQQINWPLMYEINRTNPDSVNGTVGNRSVYTMCADREDIRRYNVAAAFGKKIDERLTFDTEVTFVKQHTAYYRKMTDLLGGDYYVDYNQFAEKVYPGNNQVRQPDSNQPDHIVRVGDKFGYSYTGHFVKSFVRAGIRYRREGLEAFASGRLGYDAFRREGLYKNGLFPDSSFGYTAWHGFTAFQLKGGLNIRVSTHHRCWLNAAIMSNAPVMAHTFIAPETRNSAVSGIASERIKSFEAGYSLYTPAVNGQLSVFATGISNGTEIRHFYHEAYNTFVHYVMQDISTRHTGAEMAVQCRLLPALTVTATLTWMQVFYRSDPKGTVYRDNDTAALAVQQTAYLKNYYVAAGPQSAYTIGIHYRSRKWLDAGACFNLTDRNYTAINPLRHTEDAVDLLQPGSATLQQILRQEKLPSAFTVDIFAGRTFNLLKILRGVNGRIYIDINAGVNNILNRKDIRTAGYDQLRFDLDTQNPELFPAKYTYGFGAAYFVKVGLTF